MGSPIKKKNLRPKKLKRTSSPGAIAAALDDKLEKNASVNIALLEWDFAVNGGAEGEYNLTSKVKNLWGINDFILYAGFVAKTAITAVGATVSFGNTEDSGAFTSFTGNQAKGAKDGWISNGNIEQFVMDSTRGDLKMLIADAPVTSGKVVVAIAYVRTR